MIEVKNHMQELPNDLPMTQNFESKKMKKFSENIKKALDYS